MRHFILLEFTAQPVLHVDLLWSMVIPGMQLARACAESGVPCLPVPGACAAVAALSVAGFPCAEFLFFGFLPRRGSALNRKLDEIAEEKRTLIFYEVHNFALKNCCFVLVGSLLGNCFAFILSSILIHSGWFLF